MDMSDIIKEFLKTIDTGIEDAEKSIADALAVIPTEYKGPAERLVEDRRKKLGQAIIEHIQGKLGVGSTPVSNQMPEVSDVATCETQVGSVLQKSSWTLKVI